MLAAAQARAAVAARLIGLPLTGGQVMQGRYHPLAEHELPAWLISIDDDQIEIVDISYPATEQHTLSLSAECKLRSVADVEGQLDAAESQAAAALFSTAPPYDLQLLSSHRTPQREGEAAAATLTLRLQAIYFTRQGEPDNIL